MIAKRVVYIVDDRADYRFLLQQIFDRFLPEFPVQFFDSGETLYQYIQTPGADSAKPGLILMDLDMPGMGGLQTLTMVKQQPFWRRVPVVVMSSGQSPLAIKQCYDMEANSFLSKPVNFEQLTQQMKEICPYWLVLNELA
ncbi:response regulator [Spirosoma aerophilum]